VTSDDIVIEELAASEAALVEQNRSLREIVSVLLTELARSVAQLDCARFEIHRLKCVDRRCPTGQGRAA
jgi:hypothetical protein